MSTLANETLLENIYDEVLEELFDTGRISNCSQDDINSEVIRRFKIYQTNTIHFTNYHKCLLIQHSI